MLTMERVSPFLLHLPEDIKPDELFNCIAQVMFLKMYCLILCFTSKFHMVWVALCPRVSVMYTSAICNKLMVTSYLSFSDKTLPKAL